MKYSKKVTFVDLYQQLVVFFQNVSALKPYKNYPPHITIFCYLVVIVGTYEVSKIKLVAALRVRSTNASRSYI
jgi:hypothetical protein